MREATPQLGAGDGARAEPATPRLAEWGMVHGRYQPFHLGHLACLRQAAARCRRLLVGITNPDRSTAVPEPGDPLRHLPESNPFTYTERLLMVTAALRDAQLGIPAYVIPFPISAPELWDDYVPAGTVHFLRLFSDWGRSKAERLAAAGFQVVTLDPRAAKEISGMQVRAAMRAGDPSWIRLVPAGVAEVLHGLPSRHVRSPGPAV